MIRTTTSQDRSDRHRRSAGEERSKIAIDQDFLPPPPRHLIEGASLFLDLDGTLLEIAERPDSVRADGELHDLLRELRARLDGRLAVVSGRSLEQIDAILGDVANDLAISGSHGCEHRWQGVTARPNRPDTLDRAAERLRAFVEDRPGLLLEEKSFGVALHYRLNADAEADAHDLARAVSVALDLEVQHGKMMVELRVAGGDKGRAIHRLMARPPMRGTTPVFIGDDVTDEPAFVAARELGGHGIVIGAVQPTAADYRIASPAALRGWLAGVAR